MDAKAELLEATDPKGLLGHMIYFFPLLQLRRDLADFAMQNGLASESEAAAVIALRHFRERADAKWAKWMEGTGASEEIT